MNLDEKQMEEWKRNYEKINVPESIDEYIMQGITKRNRRKKRRFRSQISALAACVLLICFASAVRISPAFAAYVNTIPGIRNLAQLIRYDKGLQDAVQNNFIEKVNRSVSHNGVTFTVNGVIADDARMIFFYNVQSHSSESVRLQSINVRDENGKSINGGIIFDPKNIEKSISDRLTVSLGQSSKVPTAVKLKIHMKIAGKDWMGTVQVPIDKERFKNMKQVLSIHKTISIDHQIIHFEKAIIYPTRIAVYVSFDPNNSKHIFGFGQIKLADGKGNVWPLVNGVSGSIQSDNEQILYFQSNYFNEPKTLYLMGKNIRALDKDKMNVVVNLKTKQLLKKPDDRLKLGAVSQTTKALNIHFVLKTNLKSNVHTFEVGSVHDASGKFIRIMSSESEQTPELGLQKIHLKMKIGDYKEPLTFHLMDYPNRIVKSFRIQIK